MAVTGGVLVAMLAVAGVGGPAAPAIGVRSVIVTERVIVRVPLPRRSTQAPVSRWRERRGPACIAMDEVSGAAIEAPASVDFILRGGARLRAVLDSDCPGLDYYSGFYLAPGADRRICADRDAVHDRSGGACEIDRFRALSPARR